MKSKYSKILTKKFLIREYIINKKSTLQIAKEIGCECTIVNRQLKKYSIKIRNNSETQKLRDLTGKNNPNYKGDKAVTRKTYYCKEKTCKNEICYKTWKRGQGRCYSCAIKYLFKIGKNNQKGKNNANYIDGRTLEKHYCKEPNCNNEISYSNFLVGYGRCSECSYKYYKGKNNHNYIHGMGNTPYSLDFNKNLKKSVRNRDNYQCQSCGKFEIDNGRKLDVHHIDYDKENINFDNLISLCKSCHSKTNHNRNYWKQHFQTKVKV